jgi:hypothetical protein
MKLLSSLFFVILFSSCSAQSDASEMVVKYEAFTRGSSIELSATKDSITLKENQGFKTLKMSSIDWKELIKRINKFDVSKIATFIPPSNERISDKALHANLIIIIEGKEYISQTFDHGNPPKELKELLNWFFKKLEI